MEDAGTEPCSSDESCSDGVFCNGVERCVPGDELADMRGCVLGTNPCDMERVCNEDADTCDVDCSDPDADDDGVDRIECGGTDCDDSDPSRYPGNTEICDAEGVDEDCDPTTFGDRDVDEDGHVSAACCNTDESGTEVCGGDCDDSMPQRYPGLVEACDMVDNDCDTMVDEGLSRSFYYDGDGDNFGDPTMPVSGGCSPPADHVPDNTDCDDSDASRNPGNGELCDEKDNDCDGTVDEETSPVDWYVDVDGDGFGDESVAAVNSCAPVADRVTMGGDCDDSDGNRNPGTAEACDSVDNDCDGNVDEGVTTTYYRDADGDGFGDPAGATVQACSKPSGFADNADDCDDSNPARNPSAPEVCDGEDNDCDIGFDEGVTMTLHRDADGDGFGDPDGLTITGCGAVSGFVPNDTDCDDMDPARNPGAPEVCDGSDNDCDPSIDEGVIQTFYEDLDGDDFGNASGATMMGCTVPAGYAENSTDCDDTDAGRNPGAPEVCDTKDNDCDPNIDEGVTTTYWRDSDGDGFGNVDISVEACESPVGYASNSGDCDDSSAAKNPGATEICDMLDNDCDTRTDEAGSQTYYQDNDDDGYGNVSTAIVLGTCVTPDGFAPRAGDCNDTDDTIHQGAAELCDRKDNDCSLAGGLAGGVDASEDMDGDNFAPSDATCSGGPFPASDCNDSDPNYYPGAPELCDGLDTNCSLSGGMAGGVDVGEDLDGDMHTDPGNVCVGGPFPKDDCDDGNANTYLGATEICDALDNDCSLDGGGAAWRGRRRGPARRHRRRVHRRTPAEGRL